MASNTSTWAGQAPPTRSSTGVTGSRVFTAPARVQSFAIKNPFSKNKSKKKLKLASVSSYRLEKQDKRTELEDWLVERFGVSKAELKLELSHDFYGFRIPEEDNVTTEDEAAVERMRPPEEETVWGP